MEKRCSKCERTLDLSHFSQRNEYPDGRKSACKECLKARRDGMSRDRDLSATKSCRTCSRILPLSDFHYCPETTDKSRSSCARCLCAKAKTTREKRIHYHRQVSREYQRTSPVAKESRKKQGIKQRELYPDRLRARKQAERHFRHQPICCEACDEIGYLERHHPDYSQIYVIQWLCKPCHSHADKKRREIEAAS